MAQSSYPEDGKLNWKALVVGAIIAIVVSVGSGVAVYFITHGQIPREKIVYTVEQSATFGEGPGGLTFLTLNVENTGALPAKDVKIVVPLDPVSRLRDHRINASTGAAATFDDSSDDKKILARVESLVPNENVKISAIVAGPAPLATRISVRSDETVGKLLSSPSSADADAKGSKSTLKLVVSISTAVLVQAALFYLLYRYSGTLALRFRSPNNCAFLLLLQGLGSEADDLLTREIATGEMNAIVWANRGLAKSIMGDAISAEKYFEIASWLARFEHEKAVIAFNRAIIAVRANDLGLAYKLLQLAFEKSKREIARYCEISAEIIRSKEVSSSIKALVEENR